MSNFSLRDLQLQKYLIFSNIRVSKLLKLWAKISFMWEKQEMISSQPVINSPLNGNKGSRLFSWPVAALERRRQLGKAAASTSSALFGKCTTSLDPILVLWNSNHKLRGKSRNTKSSSSLIIYSGKQLHKKTHHHVSLLWKAVCWQPIFLLIVVI